MNYPTIRLKRCIENRDDELELFKSAINLTKYAAEAFGYTLDKKESSRHCHVMRHANGDKIIVARDRDGHDIYFSVRDQNDNGTIIDFVQRRKGLNLGQVRKELRPWVGLSDPVVERRSISRPEPVEHDRAKLIAAFHRLKDYSDNGYLERERKLKPDTIRDFAPVIRQDARGRVCFLHRQDGEVTGWEIKGLGFTGFSAGGTKALGMHMPKGDQVKRVVVVESMIDAMSYYQLHGKEGDLYVSIAGSVSKAQADQLKALVESAPVVVAATDNDEQGHKYAAMLKEWRPDVVRELPKCGKDWNDEVKQT